MSKPEIVFTLPDSMGGVASFNRNIINHSSLIKQFYSKVILIKAAEEARPPFLEKFNADETIVFNYSFKENQYHVQQRLNNLIGPSPGALVTDNVLTISAAALFKNPKTVFHLIHDYFYVNQNVEVKDLVDAAIAHSSFFSDAVFAANPRDFHGRHFYIPYGVDCRSKYPLKNNKILNLVSLGRLDEAKGVMRLYEINDALKKNLVEVNWTVIGKGPLKDALNEQWKKEKNISFREPATTAEIYDILRSQDIFVFPTMFEGTPVSILECLANAVVTVTNDLPGGIRDILTPGIGYRCEMNNIRQYAGIIGMLNKDRSLLDQVQRKCFDLAAAAYNIKNNADNYFKLFLQFNTYKRETKLTRLKRSRLDRNSLPNAAVKFLRKLKQN